MAGWRRFTTAHRLNRAVLAEVIGLELERLEDGAPLPGWLDEVVRRATELEEQRRRRS